MTPRFPSPLLANGHALIELLLALLLIALATRLLLQTSSANALLQAQAANRLQAIRLASEISAWTDRGGHHALGMPLPEAWANPPAELSADCALSLCDATQAAWYFLQDWRERLQRTLPAVRPTLCIGHPSPSMVDAVAGMGSTAYPAADQGGCDTVDGDSLLLILRWPAGSVVLPPLLLSLGAAE